MVYRAKITKIQSWVEENYNVNAYTFVRDAKDVYIEVNDEDEADLLESINKIEEKLVELVPQWYEKMESFNKIAEKRVNIALQWYEKYGRQRP